MKKEKIVVCYNQFVAEEAARARQTEEVRFMQYYEQQLLDMGRHLPEKPSTDGRWFYKVDDPTRKNGRRTITGKSKEELCHKIFLFYQSEGQIGRVPSFREVFELLQNRMIEGIRDPDKRGSRQETVARRWRTYDKYIGGTGFEDMPIDKIRPVDISHLCEMILKKNQLHQKSFYGIRVIIKQVFDMARSQGILPYTDRTSYESCDFSKCTDLLSPSVPIQKRGYTDDERDALWEAARARLDKKPDDLPTFAYLLVSLRGIRRSEVVALRWDDIRDGLIYVQRSEKEISVKGEDGKTHEKLRISDKTKTGRSRVFPVTPKVQEVIDELKKVHQRLGLRSCCLFPDSKTETGILTLNSVYHVHTYCCEHSGIETNKDIIRGPHAFRRNLATALRENGSVDIAAGLLGHTPSVDDSFYYMGVSMEEAREVLIKSGY
jgi:integrase